MRDEQTQIWKILKDAKDYRSFMNDYVQWKKSKRRDYGFASLARDAGFSARSYPRDIVRGDRKMTHSSVSRFAKAMKLKGEAARYFKLLVCKERPELFHDLKNVNVLQAMEKSRSKLAQKIVIEESQHAFAKTFKSNWPLVFAALNQNGSSAQDVHRKCRLTIKECALALEEMTAAQMVEKVSGTEKYVAKSPMMMLSNLGRNSEFNEFWLSSSNKAKSCAQKHFDHQDHFFFSVAISVKRSDLVSFRDKLKSTLFSMAEDAENSDGDEIITVTCSMIPAE